MQGLHGAAHGPPWRQQHRPPAERKDVRWQSWRGCVQQAAAAAAGRAEDGWRRRGKQRTSELQRKFPNSTWRATETTRLPVNSGRNELRIPDYDQPPPRKQSLGSAVPAAPARWQKKLEICANSKYTESSIKSWTRFISDLYKSSNPY